MSVELDVVCPRRPDRMEVCRLATVMMQSVLGEPRVDVQLADDKDRLWQVRWGTSVSAHMVEVQPGFHEFGDRWSVGVAQGERGIDLSFLLMVVVADALAILSGGFILDEVGLVGDREMPAGELFRRMFGQRPRVVEAVLAKVVHPSDEQANPQKS